MPDSKQTIILAGKIDKRTKKVTPELVKIGTLGEVRVAYDEEVKEVGEKYAWIRMDNLSRVSRRASKEAR